MGSASREALARARTVLSEANGSAQAAEDLLAASRVLATTPSLLGAFTDSTADADAKRTLADAVFASTRSSDALPVITSAVTSRWSTADQLVAGVEELGFRAFARASDSSALGSELLAALRVIASDAELELVLGSKLGDPETKAALVDRLFAGKISDAALSITTHLVRSPRGRRIRASLRDAAATISDEAGRLLAGVSSAHPLSDEQVERLSNDLQSKYGKPVDVDVVVDSSLIGGLRVRIADDVIDGTLSTRLSDLRRKLAG